MPTKKNDTPKEIAFAQTVLADSALLPMTLIRCYRELNLSERDLIVLLRVIAPCWQRGAMTVNEIMAEFRVGEEEARAIVRPFINTSLISYNAENGLYGCGGLLREIFAQWALEQRLGCPPTAEGQRRARKNASAAEKESIRAVSRLYRRFEQEMARPLKYTESDRLRTWLDDDAIAPELIEEALRRAVLQDKCTFAYISSILNSWVKQRLTTLEQVLEHDVKPAEDKPARGRKKKDPAQPGKFDDLDEALMRS